MTVWVGTSWKMNKTLDEARQYAAELLEGLDGLELGGIQPFVMPPATALSTVAQVLAGDGRVLLGAQNAQWEVRRSFGASSGRRRRAAGGDWALGAARTFWRNG